MSYSLQGLPGMLSTHCHIDLVQSNWWMVLGLFFPVLMWNMCYHQWYIQLLRVLWCHSGVVPRFQDIRRPFSHQWTPVVVEQVSSSADLLNNQHWSASSGQYSDQHLLFILNMTILLASLWQGHWRGTISQSMAHPGIKCCTRSTCHGILFPFSFHTTLCCFSPNCLCCAVQARLYHKHCRHVIGLGPYRLSMTSYPSP